MRKNQYVKRLRFSLNTNKYMYPKKCPLKIACSRPWPPSFFSVTDTKQPLKYTIIRPGSNLATPGATPTHILWISPACIYPQISSSFSLFVLWLIHPCLFFICYFVCLQIISREIAHQRFQRFDSYMPVIWILFHLSHFDNYTSFSENFLLTLSILRDRLNGESWQEDGPVSVWYKCYFYKQALILIMTVAATDLFCRECRARSACTYVHSDLAPRSPMLYH